MTSATNVTAAVSPGESRPLGWSSYARGYGAATLAVAAGATAPVILGAAQSGASGYLWLIPAVAFAAVRLGSIPGVVACALSVALTSLRSAMVSGAAPRGRLDLADTAVFVIASLVLVGLGERLRRARTAAAIQQDRSDRTYHATLRLEGDLGRVRSEQDELAKRAEGALREARAATRVHEQLLHAVSHDLRSPLVSILGFSDALVECPDDAELRTRAVEAIARNARRQKEILDELLDASRILSGKARLNLDRVDLARVAGAAAARAGGAARSRRVRIDMTSMDEGSRELAVRADAARLERAIATLIADAVHVAPPDGSIVVSAARYGATVELAIQPTGADLEAGDRAAEPELASGAAAAPVATSGEGKRGIGLVALHRLIELHGGELLSRGARPGAGHGVLLRLPACQQAEPDSEVEPPRSAVAGERAPSEEYRGHGV